VHNDGDVAVANSLVAVEMGAVQVQGTINGVGERCGNANLCSIIPGLCLKMNIPCLTPEKLLKLRETSRLCWNWPIFRQSLSALRGSERVRSQGRRPHQRGGAKPATYEHMSPHWSATNAAFWSPIFPVGGHQAQGGRLRFPFVRIRPGGYASPGRVKRPGKQRLSV